MKNYNYKMFRSNPENARRINNNVEGHPLRDSFDRDRDRIMYSKAFRRLSGKTQIFLASKDDHARNRLTHTLEVSQIARTIAKSLGLNETLVEAIALGHDIGHTPFGHVGERTLDKIMSGCYEIEGFTDAQVASGYIGFKHNWQSIKVATLFSDDLCLTTTTLWGMLNHSKKRYRECDYHTNNNEGSKICKFRCDKIKECKYNKADELSYYENYRVEKDEHLVRLSSLIKDNEAWSIEGYIVSVADEIAQRHHDIEDAIEYKLISENGLFERLGDIFSECLNLNSNYYNQAGVKNNEEWLKSYEQHKDNFNNLKECIDNDKKEKFLGCLSKFIVNILTTDVIYNTAYLFDSLINKFDIKSDDKFENIRFKIKDDLEMNKKLYSPLMIKNDEGLEKLLKNRILNSYEAQKMDGMGQYIIRELFKAYVVNPQQLPNKSITYLFNNYYRIKYGCGYKSILENNEFIEEGYYNIGNMRDELQELHFSREDKKYKIALLRTICDYISGMTDKYAMEKHRELYNIEYK